ncbi:MAG: UDP-N-acetylglucosamine 1-carboxyvinyltransferase [Acidobacteria bacterium]|nr:UDP-N-acetylglucosamine 1-carboxyvinyltransferase [Acidobacteriota bacterium]
MTASRIRVRPGNKLTGAVDVPGAKNSVLKLMAACLMADGDFTLTNVPDIDDVVTMSDLLSAIGLRIDHDTAQGKLTIINPGGLSLVAPYELVERIRASINVLGPLLGRFGEVRIALPGGDDFGSRPIDMHLNGLMQLGAEFTIRHGDVHAFAERLHGADITLDFPSVGATENLITAAVFAKGTTTIDNAAREPEIVDLCNMLVAMGASIEGIGSTTISIHGVERNALRPTTHAVIPDRVQAATYIAAAAITGGEVLVRGAVPEHMEMLLRRFDDMGITVEPQHNGVLVVGPEKLKSIDVVTLPFPGVATDYKPLVVTLLAVGDGVGIVTENLYPGRFRYVDELRRLGANIRTDGHHAIVRGVPRLSGAPVRAPDIRAGAALVVAGLVAEGETVVSDVHHIDRGYDDLVGRLASLGADITRV